MISKDTYPSRIEHDPRDTWGFNLGHIPAILAAIIVFEIMVIYCLTDNIPIGIGIFVSLPLASLSFAFFAFIFNIFGFGGYV